MDILVNNKTMIVAESCSIKELVSELDLRESKGIALALNDQIVPRSEWEKTKLAEGDKVIIIGAVAGG